ncbi:hypothetical protein A3A55_02530 [Candidatus Roizmanbacteria bacterium RIFCSPLOWO2_01_FULL_40_14]|nr:MAG: hypothetical protein A3A55_02530 [Candidatus Roizmanbacteria bacterium RIFCSPLOWO2_01_FULL_40_14]
MSAEQGKITHQDPPEEPDHYTQAAQEDPLFLLSIQNTTDDSGEFDQQLDQQIAGLGEEIQTIEAPEGDKQSSVDDLVLMAERTGRLLRFTMIRELVRNLRAIGKESLFERVQMLAQFAKRGLMPDAIAVHVAHFFARLYPPLESSPPQEEVIFQPGEPLQKKPPQKRKGLVDREDLALEADALLLAHMGEGEYISYNTLILPFLRGNAVQKHHRKVVVQAEPHLEELAEHRGVALDIFRAKQGEAKKTGYRYIPLQPEIDVKKNGLISRLFRSSLRVYRNFSQVVSRKDHQPISPNQRMSYEVAIKFLDMYELDVGEWIKHGDSIQVPYEPEKSYTFAEISYVIGYLLTPKSGVVTVEEQAEADSAFSRFQRWAQKKVKGIRFRKQKQLKLQEPEETEDLDIPEDEDPYEYLDDD